MVLQILVLEGVSDGFRMFSESVLEGFSRFYYGFRRF